MISEPYFVSSLPDNQLGERLVLFVEQEEPFIFDKDTYDESVFLSYELPKKVISYPKFLRTASGKLQRGQTVKEYLNTI